MTPMHTFRGRGMPAMVPPRTPAVLLLLALAILTSALMAQGNRERTIYVSAVDGKGEPVLGLGPEAFMVREDNQRREILRVSRASSDPIDVAVLVDNSAAASDEVTFIREGVTAFISAMLGPTGGTPSGEASPANARIAIVALADRPTVFVEYTDDRKRLAEGVGRIFSMSSTGATLLDGISETSRGLRSREAPRAVILPIVTDGVEFTNRYSKDVVSELRAGGAALHMVTIGRFLHEEEHGIRERSFLLDEGPRRSGGQRLSLLAPHGLTQALERLARELASQYKVVYGRPDSPFTPDDFEIRSTRDGITMRAVPARGETGAR